MMWFKIATLVFIIIGGVGAVWDYINTKQDNAVLEATLTSTTAAFGAYATNVEAEVAGWSQAAQILSDRYQLARDERNETIKKLSKSDFTAMAQQHPDMLARRVNAGTRRLFAQLEAATRRPGNANPTAANATRTVDVVTGDVGGD